jgi:hypothetical protein
LIARPLIRKDNPMETLPTSPPERAAAAVGCLEPRESERAGMFGGYSSERGPQRDQAGDGARALAADLAADELGFSDAWLAGDRNGDAGAG